ncbi:S8 family serine peptidase [Bradyrhizobium erythrophlei]|uniref:S8 family serine peptidase n=1 Tax=Bradyrhizobium erythrophlei TaxID=1437360 RepID=UPI0035EE3761
MYAYKRASASSRDAKFASPSDELRIAVTFRRAGGREGPTKFAPPLSLSTVTEFKPDPMVVDQALYHLSRYGFRPTRRGQYTASVRCTRALFEQTFGTRLSEVRLDPKVAYAFPSLYYPAEGAPWSMPPELGHMIDDAYIQWPHIYMGRRAKVAYTGRAKKAAHPRGSARRAGTMAGAAARLPSLKPPAVNYFHLNVPDGVTGLLNVDKVHKAGTTGKGVRVAMVDTGFAHSHPYFASKGYKSSVDLAPHATNDATDVNGHGTGESANLLAVAPGITFIGIKVDNDSDPRSGASMLEGFQQALLHDPQIISLSMGFDLRNPDGTQMSELPNNMAALEAEIQAAISRGVIVVFSSGNGHFSFPGMMPNVISAGGVFVDETNATQASDYASAFQSKIYAGRSVPDFCGLVGMLPHASYIELPVPPGCQIDREQAEPDDGQGDGTAPDDGWGVFSGTSAAAPQLAGVCALLVEKNPGLSPSDAKAILRRTARSVIRGAANPASSDDNVGEPASTSDTGAAGAGLIDAFAAWQQL